MLDLPGYVTAAGVCSFFTIALTLVCATSSNGRDGTSRSNEHGSPGTVVDAELMRLDSTAPRDPPGEGFQPKPSPSRKHAKAPLVRIEDVRASNGIPIEVVRRILSQSYGRYRVCYEAGLKRDPGLQGKVVVSFVIERNGSTSNSKDGGSTLHDTSVISCIINAVGALAFPKLEGPWAAPDGGTMSVHMQVLLTQG